MSGIHSQKHEFMLHERIAALEQENAVLQAELAKCREQRSPLQDNAYCLAPASELYLSIATATVANTLLTSSNFDQAVNTALQIIGEVLDTGRVNVIENLAPFSGSAFPSWRALEYEWNSPGTAPQYADQQAALGSYEEIPEIFERLHGGQALSYLIEEAPEPFRSAQIAIGVKSTHLVPIFVEGRWWGILGIDDCREAKQRSAAELSMLKIAADCIGCAIQRQRTQQALLEAEQVRTTELAKANEELQQRDRLLSVVAQVTKDLLENPHIEAAIACALHSIGEAAGISRMLLMQEKPEVGSGRLQHCVIQEWDASGTPRQMDDPVTQAIYNDEYGAPINELHAGQSIWRVIEDFPEPARAQQISIGVKSTGAVPIFIEGSYFGCVGFDDCRTPRQWTEQEIDVLTSGAGAIGAALHRQQLVDRLVAERVQAEQERAAELAKANNALKRSLDSLATEPSLDKFLGQVLTAIAEQFDSPLAEYWYHPEDTAYIGMMSWQGRIYNRDEIAALYPNHSGIVGHRVPPAQVHGEPLQRRKQYFITEDWDTNPFTSYERWYPQHGFHKEINVPMVLGDECIGALVVRLPRGYPITTQQIELAQALAHQATLAAQLTRLAEEAKQAAIAREQERAAQERAAELAKANEALQATINAMAEIADLDEFIPVVLQIVAQTFQADQVKDCAYYEHSTDDRVYLRYWLSKNRVFCPEELLALDGKRFATVRRLASGFTVPETYLGTPVRERTQAIILDHLAGTPEPEFDEFTCANDWHLELNVPLVVNGYAEGALVVYRPAGEQFTSAEVTLAESLGKQLALAMQANRLAAESKSRAVETAIAREQEKAAQEQAAELAKANESLRRSLEKLANEHKLDAYLEHILREALQMLGGTIAQIFLYDSNTDTLSASVGVDQQGEFLPTPGLVSELPIADPFPANITGIWQRLLNHRGAIQLDFDRDAADFWPGTIEWHRSRGNQAILCVPMLMGDVPLGLLGLASTKRIEFTASELEFMQALSQQATLAIQLTRLVEEAKQAAIFEERNRMAREIHDTLAQSFTGIVMQLEAIKRKIVAQQLDAAQTYLIRARELATTGLAEARRSVRALRPEALESYSLVNALQRLIQQMTSDTSVPVSLHVEGTPCALPADIDTNLLRIAQEALTNALRYAKANSIRLHLVFMPQAVRLSIVDDGCGFNPKSQLVTSGFGLIGMQERSQRIGGELILHSGIEQGTEVIVTVPL